MSDTGHQGASARMNDEVLALRLHQEFTTQKEASRFVRDFALSQGKRAVVDGKTSGGNNLRLKCSSENPCSFFVRLAKSKAQGVSCLRVTPFNSKHDGCSGRAKPTCEQVISFSVTTAAVSAQPTIAASALAAQVKTAEGVSVSARMLYRARDAVFGEVQGNVLDGFASLESLLAAYSTKNGGAHTDIQFDNQGGFVRGFVSHLYVAAHIDAGQQVYDKWKNEGNQVTEYAKQLLDEQSVEVGFHTVRKSSDAVAFVHDTRSFPRLVRRVDIEERTCTCPFMDQYRIPCRHMIAVLQEFKRPAQIFEKFDPCYMVMNYEAGYATSNTRNVELVLPEDLAKDPSRLPPPRLVAGPGRKRLQRIPSQGESTTKKRGRQDTNDSSRKCSKCLGTGHNRRTCDS